MWDPALDHNLTLQRIHNENTAQLKKCLLEYEFQKLNILDKSKLAPLKKKMEFHSDLIHRSYIELFKRRINKI